MWQRGHIDNIRSIGLRKTVNFVSMTALSTLFVVVAKLFLVDLAKLETLWRVLLFLGFGFVFLLLSYYFKPLLKEKRPAS